MLNPSHAGVSSGARGLNFGLNLHLHHALCMRAAKALTRLSGCTDSSEPSLLVCAISTKISYEAVPYSGPEVIKLFPSSTQLSKKFILLINVKMPTIVGILTFISMINTTVEGLKRNFFICRHFSSYEQLKFSAQLS